MSEDVVTPPVSDDALAAQPAIPNEPSEAVPSELPKSPNIKPITLVSPHGEFFDIHDPDEVPKLLAPIDAGGGGYSLPDPAEVKAYDLHKKFSTFGQQALGMAEEAVRSGSGGLSDVVEKGLGVPNEDIVGRESELSGLQKFIAGGTGLAASSFVGGEGAWLPKVGEAVSKAAGLGAEAAGKAAFEGALKAGASRAEAQAAKEIALAPFSTTAKIGSTIVSQAAENAAFQTGVEAHKMFTGQEDPNAPVQTALLEIGLGGLVGGAGGALMGVASPLWDATVGPKFNQVLKGFTDKVNGLPMSDEITNSLEKTGIAADPTVRAGLSENPELVQKFTDLAQSPTAAGQTVADKLADFRKSAADIALQAMGKTPEELPALKSLDKFSSGEKLQTDLVKSFESKLEGPVSGFDEFKEKIAPTALLDTDKAQLQEDLGKMSIDGGFHKLIGSPAESFIDRMVKSIPLQDNLGDLTRLRSNVLNEVYGSDSLSSLGLYGKLKAFFDKAENSIIDRASSGMGAEIKAGIDEARASYKQFMNDADEVATRLKPGSYGNAKQFINKLKEAKSENFVDRLSGKNDAAWLQYVKGAHPEVSQGIKDYQISRLVRDAAESSKKGEVINPEKLLSSLKTLTKENPTLKSFLVNPDSAEKLGGLDALLTKMKGLNWNHSNTAPTLSRILGGVPGAALGMVSLLTGHSPLLSGFVGGISSLVGKEVPDAIKLATLKFLSSDQPIESGAFKTMVDFIHASTKGDNLLTKGAKAVFKSGVEVLPSTMLSTEKDREKLDRALKKVQLDPESLFGVGGNLGHYLPAHQTALSQTAVTAANYLNQQRPATQQNAPLDRKMEPSKAQKSDFDRTLEIAQQPLMVLQHMKDGTLLPKDVVTLRSIYPALYQRMNQKLTVELADAIDRKESIPYATRSSLSLFMGQPLDTTMAPQSIQAIQASFTPPPPSAPQQPHHMSQASAKAFQGTADSYQTPLQAREANRNR